MGQHTHAGVFTALLGSRDREGWGASPHLSTCLMWVRRVLPTTWEIYEMLCDLTLWLSLSGLWLSISKDIIFSLMKSAPGSSMGPSAPL